MPWLGLVLVGKSLDIYAMVGETVYSQVKCYWKKVGRTIDDRTKDVVPSFKPILQYPFPTVSDCQQSTKNNKPDSQS